MPNPHSRRAVVWLSGLFFGLAWLISTAVGDEALEGRILLLAAASTTDAMEELRLEFEKLHPQVTVRTSYAASSTLAQQIVAGAAADVFLSASLEWADLLGKQDLVGKRVDLLSNRLVVIVPSDSRLAIRAAADLADPAIKRLALADPKSVPAGIYARQALEKLGLWEKLSPRVAGASDVRQALHFVETGAAEAGIVYATDAAASRKVRVAYELDPKLSMPIRYPLVLVKQERPAKAATAFYEFLLSARAADVFRRRGFIPLAGSANQQP
ncbi:MAG TPA: molybdate ABC transporter substrate-binding protein [Pirellulales bacterium]